MDDEDTWETAYRPTMRDYFLFALAILACLGALGAFLLCVDSAVKQWPGPRGGRRLHIVRSKDDERDSIPAFEVLPEVVEG